MSDSCESGNESEFHTRQNFLTSRVTLSFLNRSLLRAVNKLTVNET